MKKIIGIGGVGCNILSDLMKKNFINVELIAVNSEQNSLDDHKAVNEHPKLTHVGIEY